MQRCILLQKCVKLTILVSDKKCALKVCYLRVCFEIYQGVFFTVLLRVAVGPRRGVEVLVVPLVEN